MSLTSNTEALSSEESIRLIAQLVTDGQALDSLNLQSPVGSVLENSVCLLKEKYDFKYALRSRKFPSKNFLQQCGMALDGEEGILTQNFN